MTAKQPLIFLLGASHKTAPVELRERLFVGEQELATMLPTVQEQFGILEMAALSTCNRFELVGVIEKDGTMQDRLYEAFAALHRDQQGRNLVAADDLRQATYLYLQEDAVRHIYRVASSLDSLVVGETQITGQFKDAIALAENIQTVGTTIGRLAQEALGTAKKVRSQTAIGEGRVSISHAAIDLAKKVFGNLSQHQWVIVGAGEMASVAAKNILTYQPKQLTIINRTRTRAQSLVDELGAGQVQELSDLPNLLQSADVVISTTAAAGTVIKTDMVKQAMRARRGRPLFMIDIALPRDIDAGCGAIDDVYLFDIDDLQQVVQANKGERAKAAAEAMVLVDHGVQNFERWLATHSFKPALASFRRYLDDLCQRELQRSLTKSSLKDVSPDAQAQIERLLHAVVSRVSSDAAQAAKNPPQGITADQLATALRTMFAADEREEPAKSNGVTPQANNRSESS